jgi:hypothetical protein
MAAARSGDQATLTGVLDRQRAYLLRELHGLAKARGLAGDTSVESLLITAAELHVRADLGIVDAAEQTITAAAPEVAATTQVPVAEPGRPTAQSRRATAGLPGG